MLLMLYLFVVLCIIRLSLSETISCLDKRAQRICERNDTYCGEWDLSKRKWFPNGCRYRDVSVENANKCMNNRTISFAGDSQIRGLMLGIMFYLFGLEVEDGADVHDAASLIREGDHMIEFDRWSRMSNTSDSNELSFIIPSLELNEFNDGVSWQLQFWSLRFYGDAELFAEDVITDRMIHEKAKLDSKRNTTNRLRPSDLLMWNTGLHSKFLFNTTPYGETYYNLFIPQWLKVRNLPNAVPSVWVSMNNECHDKISLYDPQAEMVEEANYVTHQRLHHEALPYFDMAAMSRSPQRCNLTDDGLHVTQWADIVRAKMFFDHVCDEEWNWRGGQAAVETFV